MLDLMIPTTGDKFWESSEINPRIAEACAHSAARVQWREIGRSEAGRPIHACFLGEGTETVLLAAGGTGGHLFPAEALATVLTARGWRVELVTDTRVSNFGKAFPARGMHVVPSGTICATALSIARAILASSLYSGMIIATLFSS